MSLAVLELIQMESGEIVLQAEDGEEPLLSLRFSDQLTEMLGADAISLAQSMIESASYALESVADVAAADPAEADQSETTADVVRLQTSPLH